MSIREKIFYKILVLFGFSIDFKDSSLWVIRCDSYGESLIIECGIFYKVDLEVL